MLLWLVVPTWSVNVASWVLEVEMTTVMLLMTRVASEVVRQSCYTVSVNVNVSNHGAPVNGLFND